MFQRLHQRQSNAVAAAASVANPELHRETFYETKTLIYNLNSIC